MADPRYIESLRNDLLALFGEALLEDRPPDMISFPDREWDLYMVGPIRIVFRRPETANAIARLEKKLYDGRDWGKKWSRRHIDRAFAKALNQIGDQSAEQIDTALRDMANALDEEPKPLKVIFPVGGVALAQGELSIGRIRLFRMTVDQIEIVRGRLQGIINTINASDDEKARHCRQADALLGAYANLTAAEVPSAGDLEHAKEAAAALSEPVLDFLQLIAAIEEPSVKRIRVTADGDLMMRQPPRLVIADDGSEANWSQKLASRFRLELSQERVSRIIGLGFDAVVAAIAKGEDERTEFESMLINAVHWIADADRQELAEHGVLGYVTAMELLFTSDDGPISRDLSESVCVPSWQRP